MIDFACKQFDLNEIIRCALGLTKTEFSILKFFMENSRKKYSSKEITKIMSLDITTTQKAVKKLSDKEILTRFQKNLDSGGYVYYYMLKDKKAISSKVIAIISNWVNKVKSEINSFA